MLKPTGLPDAGLTWVAHAMVGTRGYELLDGLRFCYKNMIIAFGKVLILNCILTARVFTILRKNKHRAD